MLSGFISDFLGYKAFFIWVLIATIPAFLVTLFVPFPHPDHLEQSNSK
jgi:PAT family beta-lactamase induction signal transducer AmpG